MLARELSYYPEEIQEVRRRPNQERVRKVQKNTNANSYIKLVFLSVPVIVVLISLFILSGYANISSIRQDITELEREKVELERMKMDLIADLENIKSSIKIEEDAITKLGMNYPKEDQVVYITVAESSNIIEEKFYDTGFKKIVAKVLKLF